MAGKSRTLVAGALAGVALLAVGCAAGSDRFVAGPAGFWAGLWHGFILCVTFIVSLFADSVRIYELRNTGHLYDLGFVLGALVGVGGLLNPRKRWRACCRRHTVVTISPEV